MSVCRSAFEQYLVFVLERYRYPNQLFCDAGGEAESGDIAGYVVVWLWLELQLNHLFFFLHLFCLFLCASFLSLVNLSIPLSSSLSKNASISLLRRHFFGISSFRSRAL